MQAQRRRPLGVELEAPSLTGVRHGSFSPPRYGLRPELYALAYGYWLPNTVSYDTCPTPSPTVPPSTAPATKGTLEYPRYCRVAEGGGRVIDVMHPAAAVRWVALYMYGISMQPARTDDGVRCKVSDSRAIFRGCAF